MSKSNLTIDVLMEKKYRDFIGKINALNIDEKLKTMMPEEIYNNDYPAFFELIFWLFPEQYYEDNEQMKLTIKELAVFRGIPCTDDDIALVEPIITAFVKNMLYIRKKYFA